MPSATDGAVVGAAAGGAGSTPPSPGISSFDALTFLTKLRAKGSENAKVKDHAKKVIDQICDRVTVNLKTEYVASTAKVDEKNEELLFINQISEFVRVDVAEATKLLYRYLESSTMASITFEYNESSLYEVFEFYLIERSSWFKCISWILRNGDDKTFINHDLVKEFRDKLIKEKIEDLLIAHYKTKTNAVPPSRQPENNKDKSRWADQFVEEQELILECLFFANNECPRAANRQLELIKLFYDQGFGTKQKNQALFSETGKAAMMRIGFLANLILLQGFGIQKLTDEDEDHWCLGLEKPYNEMHNEISQVLSRHTQSGPTLLGWGCVLFWISARDTARSKDFKPILNKAIRYQTISYLHSSLQTITMDEYNLLSYKRLIKDYIEVFIGIIDVFLLKLSEDENSVLGDEILLLISEIFSKKSGAVLCEEFWQTEETEQALSPLGSLLTQSIAFFPSPFFNSLIHLLSSLCGTKFCAFRIHELLKRLETYTSYLPKNLPFIAIEDEQCTSTTDFELLILPGTEKIIIPQNSEGSIRSSTEDEVLVQWHNVHHSCWYLFVSTMDRVILTMNGNICSSQQISTFISWIRGILLLLHKVISLEPNIIDELQRHLAVDKSVTMFDIVDPSNKSISELQRSKNLVFRIFWLLKLFANVLNDSNPNMAYLPDLMQLITYGFQCINDFAKHSPGDVWPLLKISGILGNPSDEFLRSGFDVQMSFDEQLFAIRSGGYLRQLFSGLECRKGSYPITLAFLDILSNIVPCFQSNPESANEFLPYLLYVRTDFLNSFDSWRYENYAERWQVGAKALHLFNQVNSITSIKPKLFNSLLTNNNFHIALFSFIAIGPKTIEKVKYQRQKLEKLIYESFVLLERILLYIEETKDPAATSFQHELVSRTSGKDNTHFIQIIASYIRYQFNTQLPLIATRILQILCKMPIQDDENNVKKPPSLVAFWGIRAIYLRNAFLSRLEANREREELRVAILRLIATSLTHQPGLAEMFVTAENEDASLTESGIVPAEDRPTSSKSCIEIVVAIFFEKKVWEKSPYLLSETLILLEALWKAYPEQTTSYIEKNKEKFKSQLLKYIEPHQLSDKEEFERSEIKEVCYRRITAAYALKIAAIEIYRKNDVPWINDIKAKLCDDVEKYIKFDSQDNFNDEMLFDSQLKLFRAWKSALQVIIAKAKSKLNESSYASIVMRLIEKLEKQDGPFNDDVGEELFSTLFFFLGSPQLTDVNLPSIHDLLYQLTKCLANIKASYLPHSESAENLTQACFMGILLLVKRIPLPNPNSVKITEDMLKLNTYFSVLLPYLVISFGNQEQESTTTTICLLLEAIFLRVENPYHVYTFLKANNMFLYLWKKLIILLQNPSSVPSELPMSAAEAILRLLLNLSQHAPSAEELISLKAFEILFDFSNSASLMRKVVMGELEVYDATSSDRNIDHKIWCLIIDLLSSLLIQLRYISIEHLQNYFIMFVISFIQQYQERISHLVLMDLENQINTQVLSLGRIEETDSMTKLIYQLAKFSKEWALADINAIYWLRSKLINLCIQLSIFLLQPSQYVNQLKPISKQEKQLQQQDFATITQNLMVSIINNSIGFVQQLSGGDKSFTSPPYTPIEIIEELNILIYCCNNLSSTLPHQNCRKTAESTLFAIEIMINLSINLIVRCASASGKLPQEIHELSVRLKELCAQVNKSIAGTSYDNSFVDGSLRFLKNLLKRQQS